MMWHDGPSTQALRRQDAFRAWLTWRQAASGVEAAWQDVLAGARGARAAAYAHYYLALRLEGRAAGDLDALLDEAREPALSLHPAAA
jgi:hypothetical protein